MRGSSAAALAMMLALGACGEKPKEPSETSTAALATAAPAKPGYGPDWEAGAPSEKTPEAARAVADEYFRALEAGDYAKARSLWSDGGEASGRLPAAFAESYLPLKNLKGVTGEPGKLEGAAGSVYVEVPATLTGVDAAGVQFERRGSIILRRVNDVPGATGEQLQWRITQSEVEPQP